VVKEWNTVKDRSKEITSATKFMDVIMQVRGGLTSSEDGGTAGFHAEEVEEFSILNDDGEDVHIIVQEWINIVYPFLKEMRLEEALFIAQDMTNAVINNPVHLRKIWATLKGRVPTGQTSGGFNQSIIGKYRGVVAPQNKVLYNTLDIFENILEDPLQPDHYQ
jgi:hypothetical protein